ncbi:MAG: hypothetical protein KC645_19670, partial [Gemmatimonadetes bacterium]|nr:hypothetical protein [Gemmatimonadota bacterium]
MRAALRTATDLVLLFGAALLVRIPQLLGDGRLLDGDEAIVGLMARRLLVAGEAPLVFWGQRYGLSVVEAGAVSGSYGVLGYGDLAVRVGSLVVFALGAFCFLRALLRLDPTRPGRARILALLLVTAPAWGVWALKARGGYGTALAGTFLALYLGLVAAERRRALWPFLAGAAVGLAGAAQPLWLPGAALLTAAALGGRSAP